MVGRRLLSLWNAKISGANCSTSGANCSTSGGNCSTSGGNCSTSGGLYTSYTFTSSDKMKKGAKQRDTPPIDVKHAQFKMKFDDSLIRHFLDVFLP